MTRRGPDPCGDVYDAADTYRSRFGVAPPVLEFISVPGFAAELRAAIECDVPTSYEDFRKRRGLPPAPPDAVV
jgi:hypothetical protein